MGMGASAVLTCALATLSSPSAACVAHLITLPHCHLLGGIPVGAVLIGVGAATGVAMAIRLTSNYDVAGFRIFAQLAAYRPIWAPSCWTTQRIRSGATRPSPGSRT